jgi:hypothetical protein
MTLHANIFSYCEWNAVSENLRLAQMEVVFLGNATLQENAKWNYLLAHTEC